MKKLILLLVLLLTSCGMREYYENRNIPELYNSNIIVEWYDGNKWIEIPNVRQLDYHPGYISLHTKSGEHYIIYSGMIKLQSK